MNATTTAKTFSCSPAQAIAQMKRNLAQIQAMQAKAEKSGKLVNGYSADDLAFMISKVKKGWNL